MRHLVSRLYHQTKKMRRPSARLLTQLADIRTELLRAQPDVERVGTMLKKLKSSAAAKLPEYALALELAPTLTASDKQGKATVPPLTKPETVRRLQGILAAPLAAPEPPKTVRTHSKSGKTTPKTNAKPKSKARAKKKKTTKRKTTRKKRAKSTSRKRGD
jgi:hypothetical protein